MATNGLVLIKPTSVASTGTRVNRSATINTNGSVTFTVCDSVSLNGVFSSTYDNYIVDIRYDTLSTGRELITMRLRLSGTDNQTASSYVSQLLRSTSTTVSGSRTTTTHGIIGAYETDSSLKEGLEVFFYGPNLAQPTAWRGVGVNAGSGASIDVYAGTHNQSTGYDGFTMGVFTDDGFSGLVKVYGLVK